MLITATDRDWERFGRTDPYFGVLVENKYRTANLQSRIRDEFFRTGEEHISLVIERIRRKFEHCGPFRRALDFGCGVGRLTIPLAKWAEEVVGTDVSPSMLAEARANCRRRNQSNVTLVQSDDRLSRLTGTFDLIHSHIVFQHIPRRRGMRILASLLARLEEEGIGVLQFTYAKDGLKRKLVSYFASRPPFAGIVNLMRGRGVFSPRMQMNDYDLNRVFRTLQMAGIREFHVESTNHGGHFGLVLYFRTPRSCQLPAR
jgi:SAM-dependent methyltransferase